jgi:hypothetical protein
MIDSKQRMIGPGRQMGEPVKPAEYEPEPYDEMSGPMPGARWCDRIPGRVTGPVYYRAWGTGTAFICLPNELDPITVRALAALASKRIDAHDRLDFIGMACSDARCRKVLDWCLRWSALVQRSFVRPLRVVVEHDDIMGEYRPGGEAASHIDIMQLLLEADWCCVNGVSAEEWLWTWGRWERERLDHAAQDEQAAAPEDDEADEA